MHADLAIIFHEAEDHYLGQPELSDFRQHIDSLSYRLEVYQYLRDREIAIFQPIADQLLEAFANEDPQRLERALKHWLAVMRYCAMAMLLNNPEFLQHRLLEWLTDVIEAHNLKAIERHLYDLLAASLPAVLAQEQWQCIQPFLGQARFTLLGDKTPATTAMILGETNYD